MIRANRIEIEVRQRAIQQPLMVPLVGGPFDGRRKVPPPDDGEPHVAFAYLPVGQQDMMPDYAVGAFYVWDHNKKQWTFFTIEAIKAGPDGVDRRMREIAEASKTQRLLDDNGRRMDGN